MLSSDPEVVESPASPVRLTDPGTWPVYWPLQLTLVLFPFWWVMGLSDLMPILMAVPMAHQLLTRRPVRTPPGFPIWLLFLLSVCASGLMLWLDAPGAVPGGGSSRLLVFGYRLSWYLACTTILLWVGNLRRDELPTMKVVRLFGWMFVVTAFGGLLGVLAPDFEITSPVEMLLPKGLTSNAFVRTIVHPSAASVQNLLGEESPRPIAPFAFANSWGANLSMFLPFFVLGWLGRRAGWRRPLGMFAAVVAAVPIVFSLNRGLWASLMVGALVVVVKLALDGRPGILVAVLVAALVGVLVFISTPLADMTSERLDNPHSNSRRGQLLTLTVESVAEGSPVVGYGSTRDVQGSFASIAGGATPDCPACRVPSLGTQGQIWLVVFSQGFLGLIAFVGFFAAQLGRHWRSRDPVEFAGVICLVFFFLQMFVYDTLGMPMYTLMAAIGLMWRRQADDPLRGGSKGSTIEAIARTLRRNRVLIAALVLLGAMGGLWMSRTAETSYSASVLVLLEEAPVHLDLDSEGEPSSITVDTEASMVFSEAAIDRVRADLGVGDDVRLRPRIEVTAPENTRVLRIAVTGEDPEEVARFADSLAASYIEVRSAYMSLRRDQVLADLNEQIDSGLLEELDAGVDAEDDLLSAEEVELMLDSVLAMPDRAGEALRPAEVVVKGTHPELPVVSGGLLGATLAFLVIWVRGRLRDLDRTPVALDR